MSPCVQEDIYNSDLRNKRSPTQKVFTNHVAGKLQHFYQSWLLKRQRKLLFLKQNKTKQRNVRIKVGIRVTEDLPNNSMRSLNSRWFLSNWLSAEPIATPSHPLHFQSPLVLSGVSWWFPERPEALYSTAGAHFIRSGVGTENWGVSSLNSTSAC